jgi:hypothetical protein
MAPERTPGHHERGPGRRGLDESGATKGLGRSLTAAARQEVDALLHPYGELAEPSDVSERCGRHRQERRRRRTLELPSAHLAAEPAVDPAARHASIDMGSREPRVVHDLLLRGRRNAARLAAPAQLPDQLRATGVQLRRRLLGRPSRNPTPRRANHAHAPGPASMKDPAWHTCS